MTAAAQCTWKTCRVITEKTQNNNVGNTCELERPSTSPLTHPQCLTTGSVPSECVLSFY